MLIFHLESKHKKYTYTRCGTMCFRTREVKKRQSKSDEQQKEKEKVMKNKKNKRK